MGLAAAAIDVSDGVAEDLRLMCRASGAGALVDADALPISDDVRVVCEAAGLDPVELALTGGEDFELLFAARSVRGTRGTLAGGRVPYTVIGEIVPEAEGIRLRRGPGLPEPLSARGWLHF